MERKRAQVISLPTDKFTGLFKTVDKDGDITLHYSLIEKVRENNEGFHLYIVTDDEIKEGDWYIYKSTFLDGTVKTQEQFDKAEWNVSQCGENGEPGCHRAQFGKNAENGICGCYKIIATTDPELRKYGLYDNGEYTDQLPQPSKAFIEKYCKEGGIDEVDVEYKLYYEAPAYPTNEYSSEPKVDSHNTITIHPINRSNLRPCE